MTQHRFLSSGLACGFLCSACLLSLELNAQVTVQLPTYTVTGVSTTVLVPDRGTAYFGGVTSSSIGSRGYGSPLVGRLPGLNRNLSNRAYGRATSVNDFWASATIIDNTELDRAVLAEAEQRQRARLQPRNTHAPRPRLSQRTQVALKNTSSESDRVSLYFNRAQRAEAQGQPQIAKIFYQRIAKHGSPSQKALAQQRLAKNAATLRSQ